MSDKAEGAGAAKDGTTIDVARIMDLIPHRYPFLLVDRVENLVPSESAVGIKNVTMNEQFFQGHFPGHPVMPGVLIVEAMAQTAAVVVVAGLEAADEGHLVYFMSVESARFRKPVTPGDSLRIHVNKLRGRGKVWKFEGRAEVEGAVVADAVFTAMIRDPE